MNNFNTIMLSDSYKTCHYALYPDETEYTFMYIESRGGKYDDIVFEGLRGFLKKYLEGVVITMDMIHEAEDILRLHGVPFNKEGWTRIVEKHGGKLPLKIVAPPEGMVVKNKNILVGVVNTDPEFPWLPPYIETPLLRAIWYPSTLASMCLSIKRKLKGYLETTSDRLDGLDFMLHNFGSRGVSSLESDMIGSTAHLSVFKGTDSLASLIYARDVYDSKCAGFSVVASEHTTMTIRGREGETLQFKRMLDKFGEKDRIISCVPDGYDIFNAIKVWGTELKQQVLDTGCKLVIRPDSGDPVDMSLAVVEELAKYYGYTVNSKGYKSLPENIGVLYGDGINEESIVKILENLKVNGWAADNMVFGMGGALLQGFDRDTGKWAMKCSAAMLDGNWVDVFKDPITDQGKRSKRGVLDLVADEDGKHRTVRVDDEVNLPSVMETYFLNGSITYHQDLEDVRENVEKSL